MADIWQGIRTSANPIYVLSAARRESSDDLICASSKSLGKEVCLEREVTSPFLKGKEIRAYSILSPKQVVIIPYETACNGTRLIGAEIFQFKFPRTFDYLKLNESFLRSREKGKMDHERWYGYIYPKNIELMRKAKILTPDSASQASFALDKNGDYAFTSGYGITLKNDVLESMEYILGLLNSRLLDFYFKKISTPIRGGFFRYFHGFLKKLPVRRIDFSNFNDKNYHDEIVAKVNKIMEINLHLKQAKIPQEKQIARERIKMLKQQIDQLVYTLYDLSEDEVAIVEHNSSDFDDNGLT